MAEYFKDEDGNVYTADHDGVREYIDYAVDESDFEEKINDEEDEVEIQGYSWSAAEVFKEMDSYAFDSEFGNWKDELAEGVESNMDFDKGIGETFGVDVCGDNHILTLCDENGGTVIVKTYEVTETDNIERNEGVFTLSLKTTDEENPIVRLTLSTERMAEFCRAYLSSKGAL